MYSTFLGGSNFEWGRAIAIDGAGNAYIAGQTKSSAAIFFDEDVRSVSSEAVPLAKTRHLANDLRLLDQRVYLRGRERNVARSTRQALFRSGESIGAKHGDCEHSNVRTHSAEGLTGEVKPPL